MAAVMSYSSASTDMPSQDDILDESRLFAWLKLCSAQGLRGRSTKTTAWPVFKASQQPNVSPQQWWWLAQSAEWLEGLLRFAGCAMLGSRLRAMSFSQWTEWSGGAGREHWRWALKRVESRARDGLVFPGGGVDANLDADLVYRFAKVRLYASISQAFPALLPCLQAYPPHQPLSLWGHEDQDDAPVLPIPLMNAMPLSLEEWLECARLYQALGAQDAQHQGRHS